MFKIASVVGLGSLHTRKRVYLRRFGFGKGEMAYFLHIGKRSFYFYSKRVARPIKPQNVFA
jgi:hypothetical protein